MKKTKSKQLGVAILYAIGISAIFLVFLSWISRYLMNSLTESAQEFKKSGLAVNIARSGAEEAYFWFSRQESQPVSFSNMKNLYASIDPKIISYPDASFYPRYALDPNSRDTDNEKIGLVKDVLIDKSNNLYGHFEVKRQLKCNYYNSLSPTCYNYNPVTNGYTSVTMTAATEGQNNSVFAVHDITHLKKPAEKGSGQIWRIVSTGYLYVRKDFRETERVFDVKYNEKPNVLLDNASISVDIQRISVNNIGGAVIITNGTNVTVASDGSINGAKQPAIIYTNSSSVPSTATQNYIQGSPKVQNSNILLTPDGLFNTSEFDLKGMADQSVDRVEDLSRDAKTGSLGSMSIIYINGHATFSKEYPLKGGGLLYVKGNLTIPDGANSYYSGIIYVAGLGPTSLGNGNVKVAGLNLLSGSVIVADPTSKVTLDAGYDKAQVEYSEGIIDTIKKRLAKYRINNLSYKIIGKKESL